MQMNAVVTIILFLVMMVIIGYFAKMLKYVIIVVVLATLVTGGYIQNLSSLKNVADNANISYVHKDNAEETLKIIPVFEDGKLWNTTSLPYLLNGPKKYIVEYSSEKLVGEFRKSYNEVSGTKGK